MADAKTPIPALLSTLLALLLAIAPAGVAAQEYGSPAGSTSLCAGSLVRAGVVGAAIGSLLGGGSSKYIGDDSVGPGILMLAAIGGVIGASIGVGVAGEGEVPAPNAVTAGLLGFVGGLVGGGIGLAISDSAVPPWIGFSIGQGTLTGVLGYAFRRRS